MNTELWYGNSKKRDQLDDSGINGRIILNASQGNRFGDRGLD
jgi:hypothetical protein